MRTKVREWTEGKIQRVLLFLFIVKKSLNLMSSGKPQSTVPCPRASWGSSTPVIGSPAWVGGGHEDAVTCSYHLLEGPFYTAVYFGAGLQVWRRRTLKAATL